MAPKKVTRDSLKKKKPLEDKAFFAACDEDLERLKRAEDALGRALLLKDGEDAARRELDEVRKQVEADGTVFVLRGLGRRRWEEIQREHPPTDEQRAKDKDADWNPDTFWPALLSECCANSDLTAEEWRELVFDSEDWGAGELALLRNKAIGVNTTVRVANLGN